ncbi:MAG: 3-deoxy-manno-octulosonate cytidylyltransferase [Candidatus Omnitrophota bacterium]
MKAAGVIPARYAAQRFPGKVLAELLGKPVVQYVYEEARKSRCLEEIIIACDDERVFKAVQRFGARAVMTGRGHNSGTDRIAEAAGSIDAQIVVNIQADEPLLHFSMLDGMADCLIKEPAVCMATLIHKIEDPQELSNTNVVKVVKDSNDFALYFSRLPIPYLRDSSGEREEVPFYKHIGLYAYTKDFLMTFTHLKEGRLERAERLEQLRALEYGYRIKLIETNFDTVSVDTPADLEKVKQLMLNKSGRINE